jgi:hypothetical protein
MKDVASAGADEGVIKRGAEINEHECAGEYGAADDDERGAACGGDDEINRSHDSEGEADAVRDGVGENVAEVGVRRHRLMIVRAR